MLDPYHGIERGWDSVDESLAMLDEVIQLEGPHTIAGFILETVTGTNGILVPPDGYLQGVRDLCTRHGILMICDEVMSGFGRTGEWFAVDHWKRRARHHHDGQGPDERLHAARRRRHASSASRTTSPPNVFWGGLTYGSHPVACAAALATIKVYEDDGLIENARRMGSLDGGSDDGSRAASSVGRRRAFDRAVRARRARPRSRQPCPSRPSAATSTEMAALATFFRQEGLYTFVRWNTFFTNPPLCITEGELREAFAIIDRGLEITDRAVG